LLGKDAPSRARKVMRVGDTIFATVRPYLKRIAMVPDDLNGGICSTAFVSCALTRAEWTPVSSSSPYRGMILCGGLRNCSVVRATRPSVTVTFAASLYPAPAVRTSSHCPCAAVGAAGTGDPSARVGVGAGTQSRPDGVSLHPRHPQRSHQADRDWRGARELGDWSTGRHC